ncbi:probable tRNA (uracil-O(2)-)-methyltransferase [Phymastichus coffea]|uniref:probable tRNA (uracil-O(2)-)-methyltransferase n=1 Tax=Phymastichus coffea TaxID=108790 RepID=UPI00273BC352|nr:probable tRNA (uracil-O(2)-)-methyltransferase [Phymastichus coffea]XP_058797356.1 probable tRNA (uracil-O(2)-)-methyltransferase [Phymastichus coffea]
MKDFETIVSEECTAGTENFWKALGIWLKSPHLINRRISSSAQLSIHKLKTADKLKILDWFLNVDEIFFTTENHKDFILDCLKASNVDVTFENSENVATILSNSQNNENIYIRLAKLLPRHGNRCSQTLELSLIDLQNKSVTYIFYKCDQDNKKKSLGFDYPYQIKYENNKISIAVQHFNEWKESQNLVWLQNHFFNRLLKWIKNESPKNSLVTGSLKLVSAEKYTDLYNELKLKYGTEMVKIWPENTDPLKFVYEDVAIATYLILLWEQERERLKINEKQSFLDLGCGNGLLVHILNCEGYHGLGVDLRRRKIWDLYPETTKLEVCTIIPSSKSLYPRIDWLIGNHSDELTPWIPVIAARSSYKCRFFLLPCCAYDFDGKKYQRENSDTSQYFEYMNYVQDVANKCGFKTQIDKLRIPSTKRICLIGSERNYSMDENDLRDLKIQEMINSRCQDKEINDAWASSFKPREIIEKVRNCTKIDKSVISNIIDIVVTTLLCKARIIELERRPGITWNTGGEMELNEVAEAVDTDMLKELKKECGGLQTLLKNNGHIFRVESGKVRFRIPGKDTIGQNKRNKKKKINPNVTRKVKPCWFYLNHPNGCPLDNDECDFLHPE